MGWYDWFSLVYDPAIARLYRAHRRAAADALALTSDCTVLDLPCGTGQSLLPLTERLEEGRYVGVDLSAGMLARARRRPTDASVLWLQRDATLLSAADLAEAAGEPIQIDRLHIFLGLSAIPGWEAAFDNLWGLLRPGGRCVVVDVHADPPGLQGRMVQLIARADLRRRCWEPLSERGSGFERTTLSTDAAHGGELWMASADKPR